MPAGWGATRRAVLVDAAARAGLGAVELVAEPVAAAAYLAGRLGDTLPAGSALLVVDLGAGTADVALVRVGAVPEVIAHGGVDVGGLDIDSALVELLGKVVTAEAPDVWGRLATPAGDAERRDRLAFWQEVRAAKESLSRLTVAPVDVPGYPAGLHLTRDELEAVAAPLLAPVVDLAASLAEGEAPRNGPAPAGSAPAGLPAAGAPLPGPPLPGASLPERPLPGAPLPGPALAGVLLVGGGSRLPLLGRMLHQRLGVVPTSVERPESAVVEGALLAAPAPAVPSPPLAPRRARRRWVSPVTLGLALACFLLPFATVSCGLPDGYGRADTGGVTEYSGVDLAVGGTPKVAAEHVRPRASWRDDRLEPQPAQALALLATLAGLAAGVALARDRRRHGVVGSLAGAGAVLLVAGQAVVTVRLAAAVRGQSAIPEGKAAGDFVGTGAGFWLATGLLALVAAGNLVRWWRPRA
ncbi:Hsp70 family protein [Dactylosporangium sp. AC04546]|uniref:Hsp70 family protein n=1 Tax=Dactylosporangium sp. AC04546 TaxID=2862460 RepID=UPI001EDE9A7D|nr:Hsp70 family protein [Dactylosporangium sp. AC04546]WVK78420.1 Hsp70 family protein [Dactylosporangium sp. AC04546]